MFDLQLGQPIKLLLAYAGFEYEDKMYEMQWDAWITQKYTLGLAFPNVIAQNISISGLSVYPSKITTYTCR